MMLIVTILHVIACFVLVLTVLLQAGKGAEVGAVFGGASTTIFGSSGAGNFLTRLTTGAAIVFMATSLTLTYGTTHGTGSTLMPAQGAAPAAAPAEEAPAPEAAAPAAPAPAAPAPAEPAPVAPAAP
jgi:preprotein translocase subunit SecG